ncbi:hypothetical protein PAERUG_E16_London_17_VIM_2_04_14_05465 [Pseudomonas aeruginosa]|nr:hypothetical protein PAERUG_E16_London_17_VIM_2_04_14_05465 [Pseudomonas aeruginosa]
MCIRDRLDLLGVGRQHLVEHLLDGATVGDLLQALGLDDLVGGTLAVGHGFEDHLGDLAGDGVVLDAQDHAAQLLGGHRGLLDLQAVLVEQAAQLDHHPVGRQLGVAADALDLLEVVGHLAAGGQHAGIVGGQAVLALEAFALLHRQFRQLLAQLRQVLGFDDHRQQVGTGEVTVVVGFFLAAHGAGLVLVRVVQAGFLDHLAAVLDQLDLALDLVVDRLLDEAEGVDVLDLGAGAEFGLALRSHRDVAVAAQRALGHVAVADAQVAHQGVDRLDVGHGFLGAADIRLGNDLQQRRAGAVQVDAAHALEVFVQALAGVLLQVRAGDADALAGAVFQGDVEVALADDGMVHLAGLVALRQVRVEVVLAGEHVLPVDPCVDRQAEQAGHAYGLLV